MWSQTVPLTAAACSESDGKRDWFQTAAVHDVVWHSWAGDRDKLFCVHSVSECQFHTRSQNSIGAFLDCLPDWAQGLRHSQCSRWYAQNAVCHCPVADQSYPLFRSSTFWALFMSLSGRYLDWKNLCVNKILFNVLYSQNNMLLMAKLVIFVCSVISQGKVVALDRWDGKRNHLSMTHRLTTDYAKNYCNRTLIVKVNV